MSLSTFSISVFLLNKILFEKSAVSAVQICEVCSVYKRRCESSLLLPTQNMIVLHQSLGASTGGEISLCAPSMIDFFQLEYWMLVHNCEIRNKLLVLPFRVTDTKAWRLPLIFQKLQHWQLEIREMQHQTTKQARSRWYYQNFSLLGPLYDILMCAVVNQWYRYYRWPQPCITH